MVKNLPKKYIYGILHYYTKSNFNGVLINAALAAVLVTFMNRYEKKFKTAKIISVILLIAALAAAGSIIFLNKDLLIPAVIPVAVIIATDLIYLRYIKSLKMVEVFEDLKSEVDSSLVDLLLNDPLPVCMINNDGVILWASKSFTGLFEKSEDPINRNIVDITGLKMHQMSKHEIAEKQILISSIKKYFKVSLKQDPFKLADDGSKYRTDMFNYVSDNTDMEENMRLFDDAVQYAEINHVDSERNPDYRYRLFHWVDITDLMELRKQVEDDKTCVIHIRLDNLDDILEQAPDDRKAALSGEIETLIRKWATRCRGALVRVSKMKFVLFCDNKSLENSSQNKFPILDAVRALDTGGDIAASLSIGAGAGGKSLAQNDEFAQAALELAQGRGGDQAVLSKGIDVFYYGGRQLTGGKRAKGKSRVVAQKFIQLVEQSDKVFIMGHKLPDMDVLGSAAALSRIVRSKDREAFIVLNSTANISVPLKLLKDNEDHHIIRGEQALQKAGKKSLVILVDTHRRKMADCEELLDAVERKMIIDHHRQASDRIHDTLLDHLDSYASSTCELVTEMIQYVTSEKKSISKVEASLLMSGIALDTRNFSIKTGVLTFEAAAWLKRQGADTIEVRRLFQTDLKLFKERAEIFTSIDRVEDNIAIGYLKKSGNIAALIASAADQMLDVRGIVATFVVGMESDKTIRISARSLGEINVQLIMEKLDGGGNLTTAGTQLEVNFKEAVEMLKAAIKEYLEEESEKKNKELQKKQKRNAQ